MHRRENGLSHGRVTYGQLEDLARRFTLSKRIDSASNKVSTKARFV